MKRVAILLAVMLAASAQAVPVPPPPGTVVQAPNWVVGSEWYYSDGYALKVTSTSPQATVFDRIDAPGQWFSREGFIRKDSASATATRNAIYRTIGDKAGFSLSAAAPLTFQREYLSNGTLMVHASSWTVEGRETITVPAGTFDCWLIVWRTRSLKSDWTGFERWWYSPQAQQYVRMEYKYGPGAEGSRVLMRYHIGPATTPVAEAPAARPVEPPAVKAAAAAPVVIAPTPLVNQAETTPTKIAEAQRKPVPPASAAAPAEKPISQPMQTAKRPAVVPAVPEKPAPGLAALPASTGGSWHAQIGSSKDAAAMRAGLEKLLAGNPQLAKLPNGVTAHQVEGRGTFYRAWIGGFDRQADAQAVCSGLKSCTVFKGETQQARN